MSHGFANSKRRLGNVLSGTIHIVCLLTTLLVKSMNNSDRPTKIALGSADDGSSTVKFFAMQRQVSKSILSNGLVDEALLQPVNVLMVGSGEYTTGYVDGKASDSDKGAGVVALTMFDLRRRGKVNHLAIVGEKIVACTLHHTAYSFDES